MKKMHEFDEVYDSQQLFRLVLHAMSHPGQRQDISEFSRKMYGATPAFLALAMTLLDNEVTFAAVGDEVLRDDIISLTLARPAPPDSADFLFLRDCTAFADIVGLVKCGTLRDPQQSATLIIGISDANDSALKLSGPGIKDVLVAEVPAAVAELLALRDAQHYEYPEGIDLLFVSGGGQLLAIPRLTRWEV